MGQGGGRSVVIVQRVLPHYRLPFVEGLRRELEKDDISLRLVFGQEREGTVPRTVDFEAPWATRIRNRYIDTGMGEAVWQPCWSHLRSADLVIVEQANRLLLNYLLQWRWRNAERKLAFWGHGANFQGGDGLREVWRRKLMVRADWWFAYTELSAQRLAEAGYALHRVTIVNNALDTEDLIDCARETDARAVGAVREALALRSQHVAVYCGGLHAGKRIPFLLSACDRIRETVPDFELLVIGDGPESGLIVEAAAQRPWIRYVGPLFGRDRIPYLLCAKVMLMPGMVGLVILDSFACGIPLVTTDAPIHSPEIAYLEREVNGIMTPDDVWEYSTAVARVMTDDTYALRLRRGCVESANRYGLGEMVGRFAGGVRACFADV